LPLATVIDAAAAIIGAVLPFVTIIFLIVFITVLIVPLPLPSPLGGKEHKLIVLFLITNGSVSGCGKRVAGTHLGSGGFYLAFVITV
jgi:hypothetical protein